MAVESAADRLAFLSADEFGVSATYVTAAGAEYPISGIFDAPVASHAMPGGGVDTLDAEPTFQCRSSDLPREASDGDAGDELLIAGTAYGVVGVLSDGTGMSTLTLSLYRDADD